MKREREDKKVTEASRPQLTFFHLAASFLEEKREHAARWPRPRKPQLGLGAQLTFLLWVS